MNSMFSKNVHFSELETDNDFLPHLWAQRRIAELVDEAGLNGESKELCDEIERLCKKYGVVTPDISLVDADDGSLRRQYRSQIGRTYAPNLRKDKAIGRSKERERQKYLGHRIQRADMKYTGRKAFHRHGSMWVDSEYDGTSERKQIEFGSNAYYELMNHLPDLARYSKLAKGALSMIICYEGVNYEIIPPTV